MKRNIKRKILKIKKKISKIKFSEFDKRFKLIIDAEDGHIEIKEIFFIPQKILFSSSLKKVIACYKALLNKFFIRILNLTKRKNQHKLNQIYRKKRNNEVKPRLKIID